MKVGAQWSDALVHFGNMGIGGQSVRDEHGKEEKHDERVRREKKACFCIVRFDLLIKSMILEEKIEV